MPIEDCTAGSKKLNGEVEDERVLSQKTLSVVPVEKPWEKPVLKMLWWMPRDAIPLVPVPAPEVSGLFTGINPLVMETFCVRYGSKNREGRFAVEPTDRLPGTPNPKPPAFVLRMLASAIQGL